MKNMAATDKVTTMTKQMQASCLFSLLALVSCSWSALQIHASVIEDEARITHLGDGGVSGFYRVEPSDMPRTPGVLIRQEPLEKHQSVPGAAKNFRLLYTSTDGLRGSSITAVSGSLFLPEGDPPQSGWPIVLWSHGTVGIADICAPTWTGYVPFHNEHLKRWLDQGYAILASDYQGLGTTGTHPYLATRPAAYSNLDLLRAAQSLDHKLSDKVVVIGQSQGASAAIATAGYAPEYAPELSLLGVVVTGVPFFTPKALIALQQARPQDKVDPMLGYNFLALTLIEQLDSAFKLEDYVYASVLPTARAVGGICNRDMRKRIAQEKLTYATTFKQSPAEALKIAFAQMGYPTLKIDIPIYLGVGAEDRDTPARMQALFAKQACAANTKVQVHLYDGFDHLTVLNHSMQDSVPFVRALMNEHNISGNCDSLPF